MGDSSSQCMREKMAGLWLKSDQCKGGMAVPSSQNWEIATLAGDVLVPETTFNLRGVESVRSGFAGGTGEPFI